jgi:hypothetical protein
VAACGSSSVGPGPGLSPGDTAPGDSDAGPATTTPPPSPLDAGNDTGDSPRDSGLNDVDAGDSGDAEDSGDAGPLPPGERLSTGNDLALVGITSDEFVVYAKTAPDKSVQVFAVPLAGGPQRSIAVLPPGGSAWVDGPGAFVQAPLPFSNNPLCQVSALGVWTAGRGVVAITDSLREYSSARVSPDGRKVVFVETDARCSGEALSVTNIDGSGAALKLDVPGPIQQFSFLGNGGVYSQANTSISVFSPGTFTRAFTTDGVVYAAAPNGAWIWVGSAGTPARLLSTADGKVRLTEQAASPELSGLFDPGGSTFFYLSGSVGAIKRLDLAGTSEPTTLLSSGGSYIQQLSPDGKTLLVQIGSGDGSYDIGTMSSSNAGAVTKLGTTSGTHTYTSSMFTTDGRFVLYYDTNYAGTHPLLRSVPTKGGQPIVFTSVSPGASFGLLDGSKILTATTDDPANEWSVLEADASSGGSALVVPRASDFLGYRSLVVYTTNTRAPGLYVVAAP